MGRLLRCLRLRSCPPATQAGFLYVTRIDDADAALRHLRTAIDLRDVTGRLRQPTYVLHGRHDEIFPMRQVDLLREHFPEAPLEVVIEADGNHCAHNVAHLVRPRMADWLAAQLT